MTLHAVVAEGEVSRPWLVFLHGFSGDCREWQLVGEGLSDYPRLYVDLPGHGGSGDIRVSNFAQVSALLHDTLLSYNILNYWLVGYSLGGRVAMNFAGKHRHPGLQGLVVEGGHPGLLHDEARAARQKNDETWAMRFRHEPLEQVFADWYQQPVFASLTAPQRAALVALRAQNNGEALADMLLATSLAVQDDLRPMLAKRHYPFWYLCGERDGKFRAIAEELTVPCQIIHNAGHNAHRENPQGVTDCLAQILRL